MQDGSININSDHEQILENDEDESRLLPPEVQEVVSNYEEGRLYTPYKAFRLTYWERAKPLLAFVIFLFAIIDESLELSGETSFVFYLKIFNIIFCALMALWTAYLSIERNLIKNIYYVLITPDMFVLNMGIDSYFFMKLSEIRSVEIKHKKKYLFLERKYIRIENDHEIEIDDIFQNFADINYELQKSVLLGEEVNRNE